MPVWRSRWLSDDAKARFGAPLRVRRGLFVAVGGVALSAALSGCITSNTAEPTFLFNDCMADRADVVAAADWTGAQPYRVRIVEGDYRPMVMYLEQNRPYTLVVENVDDTAHDIWAPDFLKSGVALDSVQFGDKAPAKGCVNGIRIKARSKVAIRFVPVWEGRYEIRDVSFALVPTIGATAVVNIIPQRRGPAEN